MCQQIFPRFTLLTHSQIKKQMSLSVIVTVVATEIGLGHVEGKSLIHFGLGLPYFLKFQHSIVAPELL